MKTAEETERIVREVIRRLKAAKSAAVPPVGTLLIDARVITLATLESRLEGVRQIIVQPQAVVTPSVQDELRAQNIELVRQSQPTDAQTTPRLFVANPGNLLIADLIDQLPCDVTQLGQASLEATIVNMASLLTATARGVIFADAPEAAACLANRHSNVNAFVGHNHDSICRAAATMAANLLVLESSSNAAALKDMLRSFVSAAHGSNK